MPLGVQGLWIGGRGGGVDREEPAAWPRAEHTIPCRDQTFKRKTYHIVRVASEPTRSHMLEARLLGRSKRQLKASCRRMTELTIFISRLSLTSIPSAPWAPLPGANGVISPTLKKKTGVSDERSAHRTSARQHVSPRRSKWVLIAFRESPFTCRKK